MKYIEFFNLIPLPYKFLIIPKENEPSYEREKKLKVFINKVITNLSKDVFIHSGFEIIEEFKNFNVTWGRQYTINKYPLFKSWQKVNHFAGAMLMGRKDYFHSRMIELNNRINENFYPESYNSKNQLIEIKENWLKNDLWIIKPIASSRGRGIYLLNSKKSEPIFEEESIIQKYIINPFLITGRKFDIRLYLLVTSSLPLRLYIHDSGLIRFATQQYDKNSSPENIHIHLTNFSLNKDDKLFIRCLDNNEKIEDSKWSIPFFKNYMKEIGINIEKLWNDLEHVCISTIISGFNTIRSHHSKSVQHRHTSYEIYGIDIILDEFLKPYVLEINISPGMSGSDSILDFNIKNKLMHDILRMARIIDCDASLENPCPGIDFIEKECNKSLTKERIRNIEAFKENPWINPIFDDFMNIRDFLEEKELLGNFKRIFPKKYNFNKYINYFDRLKYQDIVLIEWIKLIKEKKIKILNEKLFYYKNILNQFK